MDVQTLISDIRSRAQISQVRLAQLVGVSYASIARWERGAASPSPDQKRRLLDLQRSLGANDEHTHGQVANNGAFASRGVRQRTTDLPLFATLRQVVSLADEPLPPVLERITNGRYRSGDGQQMIRQLLSEHQIPAITAEQPPTSGISAGKNTYTYDAHTYHTKVPPQGIAELIRHYLPNGGLVFDPFAGSGMTGVACRASGYDSILNELSPAACFIADRFVTSLDPELFQAGVDAILADIAEIRAQLYTTHCRDCGKATEILYTVWSYNVICGTCGHEFLLWDHCRQYGRVVREHKILREFPCPECGSVVVKSRLRRTIAEPVQIGYRCCGSRQQEATYPPDKDDLSLLYWLEINPPLAETFIPDYEIPDGVNLCQPKHHGLNRIDQFYTPRNLTALSHIWRSIHRIKEPELAAQLAFVFTSLYQRVTRLSEFRFWGGSGNTARFNVPFIFNETNVFATFERKARSIRDHLETTAASYRARTVVIQNSATCLDYLPNQSVDLIFTDPPFGANINYSEMNMLWEAWLGSFTDQRNEAIMNRVQGKGIIEYRNLMTKSLQECFRVLKENHWLLLVFMNSSKEVWDALRYAILTAGFEIRQVDSFDKQHGTFKQFVSENTAGMDLVLHCFRPATIGQAHKIESEYHGEATHSEPSISALMF